MQKRQAQLVLEKQRRAMRQWYSENKSWYKQYRKDNAKKVRKWFDTYRKSKKGKEAIGRYEQKPHRKTAKALWNFIHRLDLKLIAGEITEYEKRKRIKEYKEKRHID